MERKHKNTHTNRHKHTHAHGPTHTQTHTHTHKNTLTHTYTLRMNEDPSWLCPVFHTVIKCQVKHEALMVTGEISPGTSSCPLNRSKRGKRWKTTSGKHHAAWTNCNTTPPRRSHLARVLLHPEACYPKEHCSASVTLNNQSNVVVYTICPNAVNTWCSRVDWCSCLYLEGVSQDPPTLSLYR